MMEKLEADDAARRIIADIQADEEKLKSLRSIPVEGMTDYKIGIRMLNAAYGTPLEGSIGGCIPDLHEAFQKRLYEPLGFTLVPVPTLDEETDVEMVKNLGRIVKQFH